MARLIARLSRPAVACFALGLSFDVASGAQYAFSAPVMGTRGAATFYAEEMPTANAAWEAIHLRWQELEAIFSDYRRDSESARIVASAQPGVPVTISPELSFLLQRSQEFSRESAGALDVTVGPVTRLWRQARRQGARPNAERLAEAQRHVGYHGYRLVQERQQVILLDERIRFDFGAVAKGYAADEAIRLLADQGISEALIDLGGDLAVGAPPPDRPQWVLGLRPFPDAPDRRIACCHCGVATSGDAERGLELSGQRLSHILDPRSGEPLVASWSVTVIAADALASDALASILTVLGPEKGLPWLERHHPDAAVQFVRNSHGTIESRQSANFARFLVSRKEN